MRNQQVVGNDRPIRRIRILHVEAGTSYGGSHKALATYLKSTISPDLSHHVLLVHRVPEMEAELRAVCPVTTLKSSILRAAGQAPKLAILGSWICEALRVYRFLRSVRMDIVHINNTFTYQPYTVAACRLAGVPAVAHMRNPVRDTRLARMAAGASQLVVAVNSDLARSIALPSRTRVEVCYDGVEEHSADWETACDLRGRLLGEGRVLIGSVGRLEAQKGFDVLIEAAARVIAAHPEVRFAIAGEGQEYTALKERISGSGLVDRIHLCGFHSDVPTFLAALDVFVCSSRFEGGPMTVAEALLASKPIVSTRVGFVPEITHDGRYAAIVPVGDAGALAEAIQIEVELLGRPRDYTVAARRRVFELTDPCTSATRFDSLCREVAGEMRCS